jgi:hypothetical protein
MRVEYGFSLSKIDIPRFSVDATEGANKLFTLSTLVLNVLQECERVDIVFHSQNPDEPRRKIGIFQRILGGAPGVGTLTWSEGDAGSLGGVYFCWLSIRSSGGAA